MAWPYREALPSTSTKQWATDNFYESVQGNNVKGIWRGSIVQPCVLGSWGASQNYELLMRVSLPKEAILSLMEGRGLCLQLEVRFSTSASQLQSFVEAVKAKSMTGGGFVTPHSWNMYLLCFRFSIVFFDLLPVFVFVL